MDPYRVWLSEIMLQQTTVPTVISYYHKFTARWPSLQDLAAASQEDVLHEWAGLGYYARGRNLHKCAQIVQASCGGIFPDTLDDLIALPGIGPYTAAAIGAMAFGIRVIPVDGNVERVIARLYAIKDPVRTAKPIIKERANQSLMQAKDVFPGDLAQAYMDLGSTICTPRSPKCALCPLSRVCTAYQQHSPQDYPTPEPKKAKPQKYGYLYLVEDSKGHILLHRREGKGLLAGMMAFPTSAWAANPDDIAIHPSLQRATQIGTVHHSFTHFDLMLRVMHIKESRTITKRGKMDIDGQWVPKDKLDKAGLPRVFNKALVYLKGDMRK